MLKGLLVGGITMGVTAVFPETLALSFLGAVLGLMSGVFPGMAMADPMTGRPVLQWIVAVMILTLGLVGLWATPVFLAAAWFLHGLWALLHRFTGMGEGVPEGLPGFFLSYDLIMTAFVAYMWSVGV